MKMTSTDDIFGKSMALKCGKSKLTSVVYLIYRLMVILFKLSPVLELVTHQGKAQ